MPQMLYWCGYIFILCYTHLKLALLLHKTVLVIFLFASTVTLVDPIHGALREVGMKLKNTSMIPLLGEGVCFGGAIWGHSQTSESKGEGGSPNVNVTK